ncbi:MAG: hypothetical protein ACRC8P_00735 [Spiroplasma sp.]
MRLDIEIGIANFSHNNLYDLLVQWNPWSDCKMQVLGWPALI